MNFSSAVTGSSKIVRGVEPGLYHVHTPYVQHPEMRNQTVSASLREISDKRYLTEKLKNGLAACGIDIEKDILMFDRTENRIVITVRTLQLAQQLVKKGQIYLKDSGRMRFYVNEPKKWVMTIMKVPGHIAPEDLRTALSTFGTIHRIYRKDVYTSKASTMKLPGPNIIVQYSEVRKVPPHRMIVDTNTTVEAIWNLPPEDMVSAEHIKDFKNEWNELPQEVREKHTRNNQQQQQQTITQNPVTTSKETQQNEMTKPTSKNTITIKDTHSKKASTDSPRSNSKTPTAKENIPAATQSNSASARHVETSDTNTSTTNKSTTTPTSSKWAAYETTISEIEGEPNFRETYHEIISTQTIPPMRTFEIQPSNTDPLKNTNETNNDITNVTNNKDDREDETIEVMETSQGMECGSDTTKPRNKRTIQESPTRDGFKKVDRPAKKKANKTKMKYITNKIIPYKGSINMDNKNKIKYCEKTNEYTCLGPLSWILSSGMKIFLWKNVLDQAALEKGIKYEDLPRIEGYEGVSTEPGLRCSKVRSLSSELSVLKEELGKDLAKETKEFVFRNFTLFFDDTA